MNEFLKNTDAKDVEEALKLAKQVFDTSNECFDAILFQVEYEDDPLIREKS